MGSWHDRPLRRWLATDCRAGRGKKKLSGQRSEAQHAQIGRQELYGELLDNVPGALWTRGYWPPEWAPVAVSSRRLVCSFADVLGGDLIVTAHKHLIPNDIT